MSISKSELFTYFASERADIASFGVKRLGVFGSVALEKNSPSSDIDLLVEFSPGKKTGDNFFGLAFLLQDRLKQKIDLVTPEGLSPYMKESILSSTEYFEIQ